VTAPHRAPLKVTTSGSIAGADLRGLAALLLKLDQAPPVRLVSNPQPEPDGREAEPAQHDDRA
jgi:hypothetical protein